MKSRKILTVCILLVISMLLGSCDWKEWLGSNDDVEASGDETDSVEDTNPMAGPTRIVELVTDGKANYKVIIPESTSEGLMLYVNDLRDALREATGVSFYAYDDYTQDGKASHSAGEIIIGNCKRTDAQNALTTLKYKDYTVQLTESNILITGHEDGSVGKAIKEFIKMLNAENLVKNGKTTAVKWYGDFTYQAKYSKIAPTINNVSLSQYTIVYPHEVSMEAAVSLQTKIAKQFGDVLPIVSDETAETSYEILMGKTNRMFSATVYESENAPGLMEYDFFTDGSKLQLASGGLFSLNYAVDGLNTYFGSKKPTLEPLIEMDAVKLPMDTVSSCSGEYRFMTFNILVEYEGWGSGGIIVPDVEVRKELAANLILQYRPDVVALQEVTLAWHQQLPELIGDEYGFLEVDRGDGNKNYSVLIYRKDRLRVVDSGYTDIEAGNSGNYRIAVWAVLEDLQTQERFAAFGTHWSVTTEEARVIEATRMSDVIKNVTQNYSVPVVAMGDLNSTGRAVQEFQTLSGLTQTAANGPDYIFHSGQSVQVVYTETVEKNYAEYASDHAPVIADVNLGS